MKFKGFSGWLNYKNKSAIIVRLKKRFCDVPDRQWTDQKCPVWLILMWIYIYVNSFWESNEKYVTIFLAYSEKN